MCRFTLTYSIHNVTNDIMAAGVMQKLDSCKTYIGYKISNYTANYTSKHRVNSANGYIKEIRYRKPFFLK